jgi:hypothetical protein
MHRPQSLALGEAIPAFPQGRGKLLLEFGLNDLQSPAHKLADRILPQPFCKGIYRKDSGILGPFLPLLVGLDLEISRLEETLAALEPPPYPKPLSRLKNPGQIAPSEAEQHTLGSLVLDHYLQGFAVTPADPCPGADPHKHAHPIRGIGILEAIRVAAILIAVWVVAKQLVEGANTKTPEAAPQHRPYTVKLLDCLVVLM